MAGTSQQAPRKQLAKVAARKLARGGEMKPACMNPSKIIASQQPTLTKRILSQEPDVTVVVGSGETKREFQCYGVILAAASPVLDAMLSSGMKESQKREITFPDKNPEEFEMVLRCIDPAGALLFTLLDADYTEKAFAADALNESNVRILAPWFNELQMEPYLSFSDSIIGLEVKFSPDETFNCSSLVGLLSFAAKYNLNTTKEIAEGKVSTQLERFLWGVGNPDSFNLETVQQLIEIFRPISIEAVATKVQDKDRPTKKQRLERSCDIVLEPCHCRVLWSQIKSCLDLSLLTEAMVNDDNVFYNLVYYALHRYRKTMEIELGRIASELAGKDGPFYGEIDSDHSSYNYGVKLFKIGKKGETLIESDVMNAIDRMMGCVCLEHGNFSREYELSEDENMFSLVCRLNKDATDKRPNPRVDVSPTTTAEGGGIRYREADLTVLVGSGDGMKEFQCHSAILSFASAKLDSLIAAASGDQLLLPNIDPKGWELFMKSIDQRHIDPFLTEDYDMDYNTTCPKLRLLMPVYKAFEMPKHLDHTVGSLTHYVAIQTFDGLSHPSDFDWDEVLKIFRLAVEHDLKEPKQEAEKFFAIVLGDGNLLDHIEHGDVDLKIIQGLISLCLPVKRKTSQDDFLSNSWPALWRALSSNIEDHLKLVTFHKVNGNECEMFSHLVYSFLCREADNN